VLLQLAQGHLHFHGSTIVQHVKVGIVKVYNTLSVLILMNAREYSTRAIVQSALGSCWNLVRFDVDVLAKR